MESYKMVLLCTCSALLAAGLPPAPGFCRATDLLLPDVTCPPQQPATISHRPVLLNTKVEEDSTQEKPPGVEVELYDDNNQKEEELGEEGKDAYKVRSRRGLLLGPLIGAKIKRAVLLGTEAKCAKLKSDSGDVINTRYAEGFQESYAGLPLSLESSEILMPGDVRKARGIWRPGLSHRNSRSRRDLRRNSWLSQENSAVVRPARCRNTGRLRAWDLQQHPLSGKKHKVFDEIDELREESYLPEENAETELPDSNSNEIKDSEDQVMQTIDTPLQPTRDVRSLRMLQPRQTSSSRLWFPFSDEPSVHATSNGILLPPYRAEDLLARTPSRRSPKHPHKVPPRKGLKETDTKTDINHTEMIGKQHSPSSDRQRKDAAERYDDREEQEHTHQSDHQQPPSNDEFVQRNSQVPPKSYSLRNQHEYKQPSYLPSSSRLYHRDHYDAYPRQYNYANQQPVEPQRSFNTYQSISKDTNPSQTHTPYHHGSSVSHNYEPVSDGGHPSQTGQLLEHPQAGKIKYEPLSMNKHYQSREETPAKIVDNQSKFHALGLENDLRTVWKEIASSTRNQADAIRHSKDEEREGNSFNTKEEVRGLEGDAELGKGLSMQKQPVSSNEVISRLRLNAGSETKHNSEKVKDINSVKTGTQLTFNQKSEGSRGEVSRLQQPCKRPAPQSPPSSEPFSLLPCREECEKVAGIMHCLGRRAIDISEHLQKLAEAASILEGKVNAPPVKQHTVAHSQYS